MAKVLSVLDTPTDSSDTYRLELWCLGCQKPDGIPGARVSGTDYSPQAARAAAEAMADLAGWAPELRDGPHWAWLCPSCKPTRKDGTDVTHHHA